MVSCILSFVFSRAQTDGPLTRGKCEGSFGLVDETLLPFWSFGCPFCASAG